MRAVQMELERQLKHVEATLLETRTRVACACANACEGSLFMRTAKRDLKLLDQMVAAISEARVQVERLGDDFMCEEALAGWKQA